MALKFRRGTDSGRSAITPAEGEPIFTTDTKKLYVGDGSTAGGIAVDTAVSDGDKGDITVSSSGATWTIDNDAVSYAKIQNVSAASRLLGRGSDSGSGDVQELTIGSGLTLTGTELSASGGGGSVLNEPKAVVTKTADESVTSSTTLQDDDELYYALTGGKTYLIHTFLLVTRPNTSASPGISVSFDGNSEGYFGNFAISVGSQSNVLANGTNMVNATSWSVNANVPAYQTYITVVKPASNITLKLRFAQFTSSATAITVMKGSRMIIWEVA